MRLMRPMGILAKRSWRVGARQQALVHPPDAAVTFARRFFEARPVDHRDAAAALLDQSRHLERAGHHTHGRAL
jgi:hypothetical protein